MQAFRGRRVTRTYTWEIPAPPEEVHPLLCPVREEEWIPGWSCDLIYSDSGVAEEGCVFTTSFPGEGREVWVITGHDPERHLFQALRFIEGSRVARVDVSLSSADGTSTTLVWKQTITALDEAGNQYIDTFPEEAHEARMSVLGKLLAHYYSEKDAGRLEQICRYRRAGLALEDIRQILDTRGGKLAVVLERRLDELNGEIQRLQEQQQFIVGLLENRGRLARVRVMNRDRWVSLLTAAGFSPEDMRRWHIQFERSAPEEHREFLEFLCITKREIRHIRSWAAAADS